MDNSKIAELLYTTDDIEKIGRDSLTIASGVLSESKAQLLTQKYQEITKPHVFHKGMIVQWKSPAMMNRVIAGDGQPMIVYQVLDNPVMTSDPGQMHKYFNESLDILVGFLDDDDDLIFVYLNSRRLKPGLNLVGENEE